MSYANFKPVVWSKYIEHELPKFTVYKQDCDYKFENEAGQGKRVKISSYLFVIRGIVYKVSVFA